MEKKYNIKFADNATGRVYGINLLVIESGYVHNIEITINPDSGCATRRGKIPSKNIQVNRLEEITEEIKQ